MPTKIKAEILAHSKNEFGDVLTTFLCTFPRIILAEVNTHRAASRNSASSRAIPFAKMIESIENDPFIPIAYQYDHKGMQGTEYISEYQKSAADSYWLAARDAAVFTAKGVNEFGITKQLANRILEPFMWHTAIITIGDEGLENLFDLRCPQYDIEGYRAGTFRSRKDALKAWDSKGDFPEIEDNLGWLHLNKGQAEIHMMALAEAMYDAYYESTPELLKAGEWHIPYKKEIQEQFGNELEKIPFVDGLFNVPPMTMISSVMCARVSYTVAGHDLTEWTAKKYVNKATELSVAKPLHASPFEHCNQTMSTEERKAYTRTIPVDEETNDIHKVSLGWCRNFKGFIQLRHMLETFK